MRMSRVVLVGALFALCTLLAGAGWAAEGDIVFERKGGAESGFPPTVFPHWVHRIRFKCYACHPAIYEMKKGVADVSMDAIQRGESCGVCHNDRIAFGVSVDSCNRCHAGGQ